MVIKMLTEPISKKMIKPLAKQDGVEVFGGPWDD